MTDSAYPLLTQIEQAFKSVIWDPMIKLGEVWVEGQVPFLALPIIKQLDEFVIQEITDSIFNHFILFVDVSAIRLINPVLQSKWSTVAESLALIAEEQGETSDAYKQALALAATDFAKWVHTGG